jgi:hypothetical protein
MGDFDLVWNVPSTFEALTHDRTHPGLVKYKSLNVQMHYYRS